MPAVALDARIGFLNVVRRSFENLKKPSRAITEATGDIALGVPAPGTLENVRHNPFPVGITYLRGAAINQLGQGHETASFIFRHNTLRWFTVRLDLWRSIGHQSQGVLPLCIAESAYG